MSTLTLTLSQAWERGFKNGTLHGLGEGIIRRGDLKMVISQGSARGQNLPLPRMGEGRGEGFLLNTFRRQKV